MKRPSVLNTTFSSYTDFEIIGEGGSGSIFKAVDDKGQVVAIKILDPAKATAEKKKRFKNELSFETRNSHPNIIKVIDHGVFERENVLFPFYVMPQYECSLRVLIKRGIEVQHVLNYYSQILDGVEAAHLARIIHRDLKPENILFDKENNNLVIADFGIAHFEEEDLYTLVETLPHTRLANFLYAAPEQKISGAKVGVQSDIYALGLILNEMFTGQVPIGTGYREISQVRKEYSYLDDLISEMIRQSPDERPTSIEQIKNKLIGYKNEFVTKQRLSVVTQTVIPVTEIDDPIFNDPIRIIDFDYDKGVLTLIFQHEINPRWINALNNMGSYSSVWGKSPEYFHFNSNRASITVRDEIEGQRVIDYFKSWLPLAHAKYQSILRQEKAHEEEKARLKLIQETEELERKKRILGSLKI